MSSTAGGAELPPSAASSPYLPEVAESDVGATTAALFDAIRRTTGLPVVNLVYRHLATSPGRLASAWGALEPNVRHLAAHGVAAQIASSLAPPAVRPIPAAAIAAAGIDAGALRGVEATLAVYSRGNATNLIALTALLHGTEGAAPGRPPAAPAIDPAELPPMSDPARVPAASRALLFEISRAVAGDGEPVIVPSLLRHLADPPALLALAWTNVWRGMLSDELDRAASMLAARAAAIVPTLPFAVPAARDPETRLVLERFLAAIPRALLLGAMLRTSFEETPEWKGAMR